MANLTHEELKEMIGAEQYAILEGTGEVDNFLNKVNSCDTEEDFLKAIVNVVSGDAELKEDDLQLVVGGMSNGEAINIVASAYWDLCIRKKRKSKYSNKQINDALAKCDEMNDKLLKGSVAAMIWGIKVLLGIPV